MARYRPTCVKDFIAGKRMPWLMGKLLAAYQPNAKVRIASVIAKAEESAECQMLLTSEALPDELSEEISDEGPASARSSSVRRRSLE